MSRLLSRINISRASGTCLRARCMRAAQTTHVVSFVHTSPVRSYAQHQHAGRRLFVARHRRSMFGRRAFCVPLVCNALPDYLRDPHVPLAVFAGTWKLFFYRFTIAYTAHYRLCDSALYKSTIDTDIDTDTISGRYTDSRPTHCPCSSAVFRYYVN